MVNRNFRHRLTLETLVSWRDESGHERSAVASTRDVNSNGVYLFFNQSSPPRGTAVEIAALLPAFLQHNGITYLRGPGVVTRVEPEGFALHGDFRIETEYLRLFPEPAGGSTLSRSAPS